MSSVIAPLHFAWQLAVIARNFLAWVLAEQGNFAEASAYGEEGVRLAAELGTQHSQVQSRWAVAYLFCVKGEFAHAARLLEENIAVAR